MKGRLSMMKTQNEKYHLTDKEVELMELLWKLDKPLTSMQMLEAAGEHSWSDNYLPIMLKSLLKKKAIEVCGYVQCATQYARQFKYAITREEYIARFAISHGLKTNAIPRVAVAMVEELDEDKEEIIRELEAFIRELKEK